MTTKTIKQYLLDNYELTEINDITNQGCSGGISGFIYYNETCAFHDEYEEQIWNMLDDNAQSEGITIMELIAELNGQKDVGSMTQLKNLLCWYAVERTAHEIVNEKG